MKLIHLSDLHFGKFDLKNIDFLLQAIRPTNPDLIIISGDITQRARIEEFKLAQDFLEKLKLVSPLFVIPGNHDISPLYNPIKRILNPFGAYKEHISQNIEPLFENETVVIAGINSVRSHAIKDGKINTRQVQTVLNTIKHIENKFKIIVSHHPFDMPLVINTEAKKYVYKNYRLAKKSIAAIKEFSKTNIDILLSGHFHQSSSQTTNTRYKNLGTYSAISINSGTLSTRTRNENPAFNLITLNSTDNEVEVTTYSLINKYFNATKSVVFKKNSSLEKTHWIQKNIS